MQRVTVIPVRSHVDVAARLVYRCASVAAEGPWATGWGKFDRSGDLRVRLLTLNEHPVRLLVGLDLGELERVLALEPPQKSENRV